MSNVKIGAAGLLRLTAATAIAISILVATVPAGTYIAVKYAQMGAAIEAAATINARLVSDQVSESPSHWKFRESHLMAVLSKRLQGNIPEARRILDSNDEVVFQSMDEGNLWLVTAKSPIYDSGEIVGQFEISRSFSNAASNAIGIFLISLWLAVWSYLLLRTLPNKALNNAIADAEAAKEQANRANSDREKAEERARLRSIFLANISHELRTPMNGVLGMLGLVSDTELDDEQREYVAIAYSSGEALLKIINDILDFTKVDEGRLEIVKARFNLQEALAQIIENFRPDANKKGLQLASAIDPLLPQIAIADPVRIQQILVHLLSNALKFTQTGKVSLALNAEQENASQFLQFIVADTGMGIAKDKLEYIFDPFTQEDESITRKFGGTGLGLAFSRQLAEAMGGQLWVESVQGEGSSFYLRIPVTFEN